MDYNFRNPNDNSLIQAEVAAIHASTQPRDPILTAGAFSAAPKKSLRSTLRALAHALAGLRLF